MTARLSFLLALLVSIGIVVGAWGYAPVQTPTCVTYCIEAE